MTAEARTTPAATTMPEQERRPPAQHSSRPGTDRDWHDDPADAHCDLALGHGDGPCFAVLISQPGPELDGGRGPEQADKECGGHAQRERGGIGEAYASAAIPATPARRIRTRLPGGIPAALTSPAVPKPIANAAWPRSGRDVRQVFR